VTKNATDERLTEVNKTISEASDIEQEALISPTETNEAAQTEKDGGQENVLPVVGDTPEDCLEGESYHVESALCYRDDGSASTLFKQNGWGFQLCRRRIPRRKIIG